ncbi:nst1 [Acrasis kona]|uniref:Nst1 n=1 Tax=Acrasis kona TaxID=1008807 RepID=A0AAW2ZAV5_9EUKA
MLGTTRLIFPRVLLTRSLFYSTAVAKPVPRKPALLDIKKLVEQRNVKSKALSELKKKKGSQKMIDAAQERVVSARKRIADAMQENKNRNNEYKEKVSKKKKIEAEKQKDKRAKEKKDEEKKKKAERPKKSAAPLMHYTKKHYNNNKQELAKSLGRTPTFAELGKYNYDTFNSLPEAEKKEFVDASLQDKERYEKERATYKENNKKSTVKLTAYTQYIKDHFHEVKEEYPDEKATDIVKRLAADYNKTK